MPINWPVVGSVLLPNVGGWLGATVVRPNIPNWYEHLKKPSWRPPNWTFGPVWTSLYCSMGYASYLVYEAGGGFDGPARLPLMLYASQLGLNWAWTPIFFGAKKLGLSLAEILLLYGNILATTYAFYKISPTAGLLMIPYIGWSTLATCLTYCIWRDNKDRTITPGTTKRE